MCGISGFLDLDRSTPAESLHATARAMAATLRHRGPDDEGTWVEEESGVAFGFRRLAIIDLSAEGHQPMMSASGRYVMVFNGEVYNCRALRAELEPLGHRFRGHSDTEVMLAAITEWGVEGAVRRFVGMFAFALWDREERVLSLVRDRIGIKPLYFGWAGRTLLFGSELKALRAHPAFESTIDQDALAGFVERGYVPAPQSIYRGIAKLRQGTIATIRASEARQPIEPVAYWSARDVARRGLTSPLTLAPEEATEELDRLLRDAIRLRLESDVPLGAFLSGGVDSTTVVALMQAVATGRVRTFTIGFQEKAFDEAPAARAVAAHLGTDHTELYASPDDALSLIPQIPDWYDEPFADSSQLPTYLVSRMTRDHVAVALSGDGGDELFAGYERYVWAKRMWTMNRRLGSALRRSAAGALRLAAPRWADRLSSLIPARSRPVRLGDRLQKIAGILALDDFAAIYRRLVFPFADEAPLLAAPHPPPQDATSDPTLVADFPDLVARAQFIDLVTYLPDDILLKVDRASMAVSLEARVPILDHRVVEFAWRLPPEMRVRNGRRKWLLRRVADRYVPSALLDRPKMGFGVPLESWLRGPLREWAEALLDERKLAADGIFRIDTVRRLWSQHLGGNHAWHYVLWNILMFQAWKARWASAYR
jgi:asparagine synthase (glutamine-hydrolysing)